MTPILNFFYPEILNAVLIQGNTDLVVIKEQPLFDVNNTELTLSEKKYVNLLTIAVQHGDGESNDAIVASKEIFTKDENEDKVLVSTSAVLGSTTHDYGVEVFSNGRVFVKTKQYATTELAQDDTSLQVGESYMCNGFHMYKQ